MYNYKFDLALAKIDTGISIDQDHAVLPFMRVAANWLKTQTECGYDSSYTILNQEVEKVIPHYKSLINKYPEDAEYVLYLGSAYGIQARVALAQKNWLDVLYSGYRGYKYVRNAWKIDSDLKDLYMPMGSLEYYSCKSPSVIQWLASVFGIDVDCEKGLEDLKVAASQSHYSWIESSNMLTYAYLYLEKDYEEALVWVEPLVQKFPGHPFFSFLKGEALAKAKRWEELAAFKPALEQFTRLENFYPRNESALKMAYINALEAFERKDYEQVIRETAWIEENYHMEFDWLLGLSCMLRGKTYDLLGRRKDAVENYKLTASLDNRYPEVEEAKLLIKSPFRL